MDQKLEVIETKDAITSDFRPIPKNNYPKSRVFWGLAFSLDPDDGIVGTGTPTVSTDGQAPNATSDPTDTDNDGTLDYYDLDSDNDDVSDVTEGGSPIAANEQLFAEGATAQRDYTVTLANDAGLRLYDVTNPAAPAFLTNTVKHRFTQIKKKNQCPALFICVLFLIKEQV